MIAAVFVIVNTHKQPKYIPGRKQLKYKTYSYIKQKYPKLYVMIWKNIQNTANQKQALRQLMIHFGLKCKIKINYIPIKFLHLHMYRK